MGLGQFSNGWEVDINMGMLMDGKQMSQVEDIIFRLGSVLLASSDVLFILVLSTREGRRL